MKYNVLKALRAASIEQLADITLRMAEVHPVTFEKILCDVAHVDTNHLFDVPYSGSRISLTTKQLNDVKATALAGNKVAGIKSLREACGIGLKEAKDLWEDMAAKGILDYKPDNYRSPGY